LKEWTARIEIIKHDVKAESATEAQQKLIEMVGERLLIEPVIEVGLRPLQAEIITDYFQKK
jgi:hypothetical protein